MQRVGVLALQGDVTRVITFQLARETSNRTYPEIGVPDPHHPLSHHGNDPEKIARMAKINQFHVSLFAEFLGKLKATPEGNGTLLDQACFDQQNAALKDSGKAADACAATNATSAFAIEVGGKVYKLDAASSGKASRPPQTLISTRAPPPSIASTLPWLVERQPWTCSWRSRWVWRCRSRCCSSTRPAATC